MFYLILLFTIVPLVELALLIWLGGQTEWWVPVLLVIAGGIAGTLLWRWQGLRTIARIRDEMAAGRIPADALIDGLLVFLAGALLLTPGMITDVAGFALLIPPLRAIVKCYTQRWLMRHVEVRTAAFRAGSSTGADNTPGSDTIIDARVLETRVEDAS